MGVSRALAALLLPALLVAACGNDGSGDEEAGATAFTTSAPAEEPEVTVTVLAATSLKGAFDEIEAGFEEEHPDVDLEVTTDGSANLATAIIEGGVPADVFASADEANLQKVIDEGLAEDGDAEVFVTNRLQIAVAEGNPLEIETLEDLDEPHVALSLCKEEVPCGSYAEQAFEAAGLPVPSAGVEDNVAGVVTKVSLGEADAGIVYVTDVLAADDDIDGIHLADDEQVIATYRASVLTEAPNPEAAAAFVAFLNSSVAQEILRGYGFGLP